MSFSKPSRHVKIAEDFSEEPSFCSEAKPARWGFEDENISSVPEEA